eukprot:3244455-Pleurochrysis_carterae.AAC.1
MSFAWRISGCRSQGLGRRRPPRRRNSSYGSTYLAFSIATPPCAPSCTPTTLTPMPSLTLSLF